ncbi:MAG: hypothetical protein Q8O59_02760 [bacterium]|nr:hypothetical protein [bacterium]
MSKKTILIIIACIIILSVGVYFFSSVNIKVAGPVADKSNQPAALKIEAMKNQADVQLTSEQIEKNQAAIPEAIKQGNLDQCSSLDGNFKAVCQYNIVINQAVNNSDIAICAQISDELYKKNCVDLVAANKKTDVITTVKQGETAQTEAEKNKATILSGTAYNNLIAAEKEGKLTEPIFNEYIKLVAYANQPELCWELPENLRQECLERVYILQAKKADDTKICDKIPTPAWKEECYAEVLTRRAADKNDSKICEQISGAANRAKCLSNF